MLAYGVTDFFPVPKSPGLIILEHEIASVTVDAFMTAYPMIKSNGWKFMSLAKAIGDGSTYQNAEGSMSDDVESAGIILPASSSSSELESTTSASAATATTSPASLTTSIASTAHNLAAPTSETSPLASASGLQAKISIFLLSMSLVIVGLSSALDLGL